MVTHLVTQWLLMVTRGYSLSFYSQPTGYVFSDLQSVQKHKWQRFTTVNTPKIKVNTPKWKSTSIYTYFFVWRHQKSKPKMWKNPHTDSINGGSNIRFGETIPVCRYNHGNITKGECVTLYTEIPRTVPQTTVDKIYWDFLNVH